MSWLHDSVFYSFQRLHRARNNHHTHGIDTYNFAWGVTGDHLLFARSGLMSIFAFIVIYHCKRLIDDRAIPSGLGFRVGMIINNINSEIGMAQFWLGTH